MIRDHDRKEKKTKGGTEKRFIDRNLTSERKEDRKSCIHSVRYIEAGSKGSIETRQRVLAIGTFGHAIRSGLACTTRQDRVIKFKRKESGKKPRLAPCSSLK